VTDSNEGAPMTEAVTDPDVIDGTAVDETPHTPGVALEPAEDRGVLMPVAPDEAKAAMAAYQETTRAILDASDWQGRPGQRGSFVKKSGWRKIAKAYRLSCQLVSIRVERDDEGNPTRAEAVVRASAPNGQAQDADGYCSSDEPRFADVRGRLKIENDLRATATTRAKNRAISDLVGFGEVSAEEVHAPAAPAGPVMCGEKDEMAARMACAYLLNDQVRGGEVAAWLVKDQGGFPVGACRLVLALEKAMRASSDVPVPDPVEAEPVPSDLDGVPF